MCQSLDYPIEPNSGGPGSLSDKLLAVYACPVYVLQYLPVVVRILKQALIGPF